MATAALPAAPPIATIDRRDDLTYGEFRRDFLFPLKPVVLAGALKKWPAYGKWTPEFFKTRFGDRVLQLEQPTTVAELIDRVLASDESNPSPYLHSQHLKHVFPELLDDIEPRPIYLGPNWLGGWFTPRSLRERCNDHTSAEIYIGGKAAGFPFLHWDDYHYHAYIGQVYGEKRFYVYPPSQTELVYPTPGRSHVSLVGNVEKPDLAKYPRFAEAKPLTTVLEGGDLLFMPSGWWHTTRMLSPSISVAMNSVNASNWTAFARDICDEMRPFHGWKTTPFSLLMAAQGAVQGIRDRLRGV